MCDRSLTAVDVYLDRDPYPVQSGIPCDGGHWITDFTSAYDLVVGDRMAVHQTDVDGDQAVYLWTVGAGYNLSRFMAPIDGAPVLNLGKAGRIIPIKWQVTDASGAPVTYLS